MNSAKAFLTNLIFSGKYTHIGGGNVSDARESTTYALFNGLVLTGIVGVAIYFVINLTTRNVAPIMLYIDVILFVFLVIMIAVARTKISLWIPAGLASGFYCIFAGYMLYSATSGNSSPVWLMLVPTILINLMKKTLSLIVFWIMFAVSGYIFFFTPAYELSLGARYFGVFVILYVFGRVVSTWLESLTAKAIESATLLEEETEELNAMRNNIDLGIFLLDKDLMLQSLFSPHMTEIFESESLAGANFLSLFRGTLLPKDVDSLEDYLGMMFTTADTTLLESINPLQQTKWQGASGVKHLSITVSRIEKHNEPFLLGTVKDISKEIELEKQIAEDEERRQKEMRVMSEIMHATPEALGEFISDAEHEFGEINNILKSNTSSHIVTLQQVYQGIHAIKSNALIIGLETLANKLHEVESGINERIGRGGLYADVLSLMFELEKIMQEVDNMKTIMKKMDQFSSAAAATDTRGIFIKSILNTIDKINGSTEDGMHKIIELDVQQLEWDDISSEKRRDIKDIVLQLVRNSCVHGVETKDIRLKKNKDEKATIHLSIVKKDAHLVIDCGDDGAGIDYQKVLEKGKSMNLLPDSTTVDDKGTLMKLITSPTFSTSDNVSQYAGRGVGLSLVVDKIKKYGGKLKIKSSKDVGTAFILTM